MAGFPWSHLGTTLGALYFSYAFILMLGCLGPHLFLLWAYDGERGPELQALKRPTEFLYGLFHPALYLLILDPGLFGAYSLPGLRAAEWILLTSYWSLRLFGASLATTRRARTVIVWLITACLGAIAVQGIRDGVLTARNLFLVNTPFQYLEVLLVSPLYLLPMAIAWRYRRQLSSPETAREPGFFVRPRAVQRAAVAVLALIAVTILASSLHASRGDAERQLLTQRDDIIRAANHAHVDPRLIAAIAWVTLREHSTPFRSAVEDVAAHAWLLDPKSHAAISGALDPSLGLTQIKPLTLMTAIAITQTGFIGTGFLGKEFRDLAPRWADIERIRNPQLQRLGIPERVNQGTKDAVVTALLDAPANLELCGFLLDVYATQWESANPAWSIRQRPEILATLFQIGFQHSRPNATPRANEFGRQVLEAMSSPFITSNFPPAG